MVLGLCYIHEETLIHLENLTSGLQPVTPDTDKDLIILCRTLVNTVTPRPMSLFTKKSSNVPSFSRKPDIIHFDVNILLYTPFCFLICFYYVLNNFKLCFLLLLIYQFHVLLL